MEISSENKTKIDILLNEHNNISTAIRARTSSNEKIMGFGLTVIAVTFSIGLKENIVEIFMFVPMTILWLLSYIIYQYTEVLILGGYSKHLEEKINKIMNDDCLKFDSYIAGKLLHNKFANYPFILIGTIVSGIVIYICLNKIYCHYHKIFIYYVIVIFLLFIMVIISAAKVF